MSKDVFLSSWLASIQNFLVLLNIGKFSFDDLRKFSEDEIFDKVVSVKC